MDFWSPILTILTDLFHCTAKCASPICDLRENLECLRREMKLLNLRSQDVKSRCQQHMTPTREVAGWLEDVGEENNEVDAILKEGDELLQKKCLGRFRNIRLSHDLGNRVRRKISRVEKLTSRGVFDVVAYRSLPAVVRLPLGNTVGLDSMYERVCRLLTEDEAGIVVLYGKHGIGKTTLMKKINNGLLETSHDFDVVIWVEVSQEASEGDVQQVIGNRLQIIDSMWQNRNQQERAIEIFNIMKRIRFLLLLDNVQKPLDLSEIGVPSVSEIGVPPHVYKSKVIIATRTISSIFNEMQVNRQLEVGPLAPTEGWALFIKLIGENTLNSSPAIEQLARNILTKCEGLPYAIVMAGRQLAARNVGEWEQSTQELEYLIREEISGMEDQLMF